MSVKGSARTRGGNPVMGGSDIPMLAPIQEIGKGQVLLFRLLP